MELLSNITEEQFEVIQFLNKFTKGKWSLNEKTGLVDIEGNFNCSGITLNKGSRKKLKDFSGVRFGVVTGDFDCSFNELTSLEGAPQEVGRNFNCEGNELTSIKGAPQEVGGHFLCSDNKITSLASIVQGTSSQVLREHQKRLGMISGATITSSQV